MKRILCLIDSLASGGAQRQIVGLASMLKEKGYAVKVITYFDIPFYQIELLRNGVEYENVSCGKNPLKRLYRIGLAIKHNKPNVVISYLDIPNILTCLLHIPNLRKWKLIVSERNTTQSLSLREKFKFALYRFADCIVPNSYSQYDFIVNNFPQYAQKSHIITNFVDTELFIPLPSTAEDHPLRIIGVGRISKQKNIPMLIHAVHSLFIQGEKLHVDWYGSKYDTYQECMRLVHQYNIDDVFEFHEPCTDIFLKYQQSDLFVLPSFFEGFPNVLCEAMSCGLPVIATNVCDNERIVRHEKNGFLFQSGNTAQLAERIRQFISLPIERRRAMADVSRSLAIQLFSKEVFINEYLKIL